MANPISNLGTIPTLTVAGRVFVDLDTLIHLVAGALTGGTANRFTFRKLNTTSGYQVPASTTFKVKATHSIVFVAAATNGAYMYYQDNDSGIASNTAPTTPVYMGGDSITAYFCGKGVGVHETPIVDFSVPTTQYLGGTGDEIGAKFAAFGYEV